MVDTSGAPPQESPVCTHAQTMMAQRCNTRSPVSNNSRFRPDRFGTESLGYCFDALSRRAVGASVQSTTLSERGAGAFAARRAFAKTAAINRLHEQYSPDPTLSIDLRHARRGILDHALHNHHLRERDWNRRPDARLSRHVRKFSSPEDRRGIRRRGARGRNSRGHRCARPGMIRTKYERLAGTIGLNHNERRRRQFDDRPSPLPRSPRRRTAGVLRNGRVVSPGPVASRLCTSGQCRAACAAPTGRPPPTPDPKGALNC